jgi:hypothetical protein
MTPYERVVGALKAKHSIHKGDNWQCPAHDDRTPSLSVRRATDRETGDPIVLMNCHAGCSTTDAILPKLGIEPSELFSDAVRTGVQAELFPASHYSPVGLEILLLLPPGAERNFLVASALGRFVSYTGGRERVYSQRAITAVIVETRHRRAILAELGIKPPQFSNDILKWEMWGVAHRCSQRTLTIFVRKANACPVCRSSLADELEGRNSSSADEVQGLGSSLVDEVSEPKSVVTAPGFFKEVVTERSDPDESHTGTSLKRKRRFEPYPEVAAMEAAYRRSRKAGSE